MNWLHKGGTVSKKQIAYLAGPMRGYAEYNFPAFHAAAAKLRTHGLAVWSPAEHDVNQDGFDPAKDTAQPMKHYMKRDLPAVLEADMVCVLPGWEKSQGAQLEVHVAQTCGIPVYEAETMRPIPSARSENAEPKALTFEDRMARDAARDSEHFNAEPQAGTFRPLASGQGGPAAAPLSAISLTEGDLAAQREIHDATQSETPRTDSVADHLDREELLSLARQLERELAAANDIILKHHEIAGPLISARSSTAHQEAPQRSLEENILLTDVLNKAREVLLISIKGSPSELQSSLGALNLVCKAHWDWQSRQILLQRGAGT